MDPVRHTLNPDGKKASNIFVIFFESIAWLWRSIRSIFTPSTEDNAQPKRVRRYATLWACCLAMSCIWFFEPIWMILLFASAGLLLIPFVLATIAVVGLTAFWPAVLMWEKHRVLGFVASILVLCGFTLGPVAFNHLRNAQESSDIANADFAHPPTPLPGVVVIHLDHNGANSPDRGFFLGSHEHCPPICLALLLSRQVSQVTIIGQDVSSPDELVKIRQFQLNEGCKNRRIESAAPTLCAVETHALPSGTQLELLLQTRSTPYLPENTNIKLKRYNRLHTASANVLDGATTTPVLLHNTPVYNFDLVTLTANLGKTRQPELFPIFETLGYDTSALTPD